MKNIGLAISLIGHGIVLGWGILTLSAPVNFNTENTDIVYFDVDITDFSDELAARKGDETAKPDKDPAPIPVDRPEENQEAMNVGEGNLDTNQPFRPNERDRQIETSTPNAGKPQVEPPLVPPRPQQQQQTEPEQVESKPDTQQQQQQQQQNTEQQATVTEPVLALPTNNAPVPTGKPVVQARAQTPRGEDNIGDIINNNTTAALNREQTRGGGARGSTAQAAAGANMNVGIDGATQTVINAIRGCIQLQTSNGPLTGRDTGGLLVQVRVQVDRNGMIIGSPSLSPQGGDATAREIFSNQVNSAVYLCQSAFKQFPQDKYEQWRDLNITVRPLGL